MKKVRREHVCSRDLDRGDLKDYLVWMADVKAWNPKTYDLRSAAVRALLSYASEECMDITPIFVLNRTMHGLDIPGSEIRCFEDHQIKAPLNAPGKEKRSGHHSKVMPTLGYDTAIWIGELTGLKTCDLYLDTEIPYIRTLGRDGKCRNVPIMERTVEHLRGYLREFHGNILDPISPLFCAVTHSMRHGLSDNCTQKTLKKCTEKRQKGGVPMPENIYFHVLKKTRAMSLYQGGCLSSYIQQMLGHESISTTSGFYAFATLDTPTKALERTSLEGGNAGKNWKGKKISGALYHL